MPWFTLKNAGIAIGIALAIGASAGIAGYTGGCNSPFATLPEAELADTDEHTDVIEEVEPTSTADAKKADAQVSSTGTPLRCSGLVNAFADGNEVIVRVATDRVAAGSALLALRAPNLQCKDNKVTFADGDQVTFEEVATDQLVPALKDGVKSAKIVAGDDPITVANLSSGLTSDGRAHYNNP